MGLLDRMLGRSSAGESEASWVPATRSTHTMQRQRLVLHGWQTLEVVGESHYQDHLWRIVGGVRGDPVRCPVQAVLDPEPENPHDGNAIRVHVDDGTVGYLSREDAAAYLPGLCALRAERGRAIALEGHIVGGGSRAGGIGMLGVFLDHDPTDFGVRQRQAMRIGELRTGLAEAIATDLEDDSYNLSWLDQLSGAQCPQDIVVLRRLLETEADPIDRHFMQIELGKCLYKSRDAFASALDEFDVVCAQHHGEMDAIRAALVDKFGCVPVIDLYRQATIRCQKTRDWHSARTWAERGLVVYGSDAARPEAVADLEKRLAHAEAKLAAPARPDRPVAKQTSDVPGPMEILKCTQCGAQFQREQKRGRKPHRCPGCREV